MSDLIDRQAAIDAMRKCQTYRFSVTEPRMIMLADAEEVIEELPSAQLTHDCDTCRYNHLEWDEEPCDSCTAGGENNHWKPSAQPEQWIPCSERLPSKADHIDNMVLVCYGNGSVRFNTYMNGWVQGNPVAWMPLPESYRGDEDGK